MSQLIRHQMGALLLGALRAEGLGARDVFEGRQDPLSWFFRALVFDQSELDIMESGAVETLHVPSALVELMVDEMALALANIGPDGLATYLTGPSAPGEQQGPAIDPDQLVLDASVMLGFLNVDVAPPTLWLEQRESNRSTNERLASDLTSMAQDVGAASDAVEVHIEAALDPEDGWLDPQETVRPAGVSVHFTFDVPLVGTGDRELAEIFERGATVASNTLERMRELFRAG